MQITSGTVSFKRTYQPEQYGSKGADVTINFSLADGEDLGTGLDKVGALVKAKVLELCNIKTEKDGNVPADVKASVEKTKTAAVDATKQPVVDGQKETAAKAIADKEAAKAAKAAEKEANKAPKPEPAAQAAEPAPGASDTAEDFSEFNEDAEESQPEVTDAMLSAAMNKKVGDLKVKHAGAAPKLVKELINSFVEPPKKSHDIPQNLRGDFLKKLAALV